MKKISLAILALTFVIVTACSTPSATLVKPDFTLSQRVKLDVATVSVVDRSGIPTADSTPEAKEFKAMILASVRKWAAANVVPVGTYGEAIVVIRDASLRAQSIGHDDSWFSREQTTKYIGHVEIEINVSGVDNLREQATAQAVRYETLPDAPTVDERLGAYYRIIEGINKDLDLNLSTSMREHLASFVLPGSSQIAEGTGKQNVMQAYPTGGQPYPIPGMPYQPANNVDGQRQAAQPAAGNAPRQEPLTAQYEATYVPIPPEELNAPPKSGSNALPKLSIPKQDKREKSKAAWNMSPKPAKAQKTAYANDFKPQSLGSIPKTVGSSVVLPQSNTSPAPFDTAKTASAVGGYGALPVYQPGEAPTTLKSPIIEALAAAPAKPNQEPLTGNTMDLPAPVIIQSSPQLTTASASVSPVGPAASKEQIGLTNIAPASPSLAQAPTAAPTPLAPASPMVSEESEQRRNVSSPGEPRTKTIVGAGGRIRTIAEPSPPPPVPGNDVQPQFNQPAQQNAPADMPTSPAISAPAPMPPMEPTAGIDRPNRMPESPTDLGVTQSVPRPHPQMQPAALSASPAMTQAQTEAYAPPLPPVAPPPPSQQSISFPSSASQTPPAIKHGEPLYPTASPTRGIQPPPPVPLNARPGEPLYPTARYTSDLPPVPAGRVIAQQPGAPIAMPPPQPIPASPAYPTAPPAATALPPAPKLPTASPLLTSQDNEQRPSAENIAKPCPVPSTGSEAAYGTNCAAAYSGPAAYPTLPYTVE